MKDYSEFITEFNSILGIDRLRRDELMRKYTTWRVGGPADMFCDVASKEELLKVLELVRKHSVPFFVLGGGSNILVGDKGIRGLVIRNRIREYRIIENSGETSSEYQKLVSSWDDHHTAEARHTAVHYHYYDDRSSMENAEPVFVELSSGYLMPLFIKQMLDLEITGLEWFMRIPGTFGGWIYNNVHAKDTFIGNYIDTVDYVNDVGEIVTASWKDLEFGYDDSIFHTKSWVIVSAILRLFKGDAVLAREVADRVLTEKTKRQPGNSAGSVFHNITQEDAERNKFESNAIGYIVDKVLGWNGTHKVGGAWISEANGNFIETDGTATAQDILTVIQTVKDECKSRFGIELKEEVFRIGEF